MQYLLAASLVMGLVGLLANHLDVTSVLLAMPAVLGIAAAVGLERGKAWAWILSILADSILLILGTLTWYRAHAGVFFAALLLIPLIILLSLPAVRSYFLKRPVQNVE